MSDQMTPKETFLGVPHENAETRPTDAEVQYLDRPVLVRGADGTEHISRRIEKLTEGQEVDGPGGKYIVRRNELGYLYLSSITQQVGYKADMSVEEFTKTMLDSLDVEALARGTEFMNLVRAASSVRPEDFERRRVKAKAIVEIQPLFAHLFTDKAKQALSKRLTTVFDQRDEPTDKLGEYVRVVWQVQYATVNITDQTKRYEAIKAIIDAINDLAEMDMLGGCFAPLSSVVNGKLDSNLSLWDMLKADKIEYSEVVFLFAAVKFVPPTNPDEVQKNTTFLWLQERFPGIFHKEGELPPPWGSNSNG
jgi:hypothetical protein